MSRSIILSNGELAVALDEHGMARDIYYPHVGQEDHLRGHYVHRVGVYVDGGIHWLGSGWNIIVGCEEEALVSSIVARKDAIGVELTFSDTVSNEEAVFVRRVQIKNLSDAAREIKLYFSHQFELHKMHGSDTAYFDPRSHTIVHYKGKRVFQISAALDGTHFNDFATGRAHFQGKEGSHRDADDGALSKNPIEHGPADSIIGLYAEYEPEQIRTCDYWMGASQSVGEAHKQCERMKKRTVARVLKTTTLFWKKWVQSLEPDYGDLDEAHIALFRRSLMYSYAHTDKGGGIIASLDSDMLQYGLDTYSYVWPRDSAYVALALDKAGDPHVARRFFEFCRDAIDDEGYLMHKYWPDGALGSSWHPWFLNGETQLPIQEDETAIVLYALHAYMFKNHDLTLLEELYAPLIKKAADFLVSYRDKKTKLPLPSYDLWERKRGTSTYTTSAVFSALNAAAELSLMLGKDKEASRYTKAAKEIQVGIMKYLWNAETGTFHNAVTLKNDEVVHDSTIDISSPYGIFLFGVLPHDDERLHRAFEESVKRLSEGVWIGGIARFENDDYYRVPGPSQGNPWFLTTLWYADYLTACAKTMGDLARTKEILTWCTRHALHSGVMSEQINPHTGEQVCAGPLTWAHAAYVNTVQSYTVRQKTLKKSA